MAKTVADLVEAYEAAVRYLEEYEPQTRDWGGVHNPAALESMQSDVTAAARALIGALQRVGPVVHGGRDYRLVPSASEPAGSLLVGQTARDASAVPAP
jgi:hypothetical protein